MANRVIKATLGLTLSMLMVKIIGVVFKIPLSYLLGDEGMGYFNAAYTVYGFFYILSSSGLPKSIALAISQSKCDSQNEISRICKRLTRLLSLLGVVITAAVIIFSRELSGLIGNSKARATLVAIAPSILFVGISGVLRGYLNGMSKFGPIAISQLIEAILKLLFGISLAYFGIISSYSIPYVAALSVIGITLGALISDIYLYKSVFGKFDEKNPGNFSTAGANLSIKKIIKNAIPLTVSSSLIAFFGIIEVGIIINGLAGNGYSEDFATALYGNYSTLAIPMITLVTSLMTPLSITMLPKMAAAISEGNSAAYKAYLRALIGITLLFCFPITLVYLLFSFDILDILYPSYSSALGYLTLSALAPAATLLPLLTALNTAIEARGRFMASTISVTSGLLVRGVALIIMIKDSMLGILAAPTATVLSYLFSLIFSLILLGDKGEGRRSIISATPHILIPTILYTASYYLLYSSGLVGSGIVALLISAIIPTLIYIPYILVRAKRMLEEIS